MKLLIVFAALCAIALAAPRPEAEILKQETKVEPEGFEYTYETSDGAGQFAAAFLKNIGNDEKAFVIQGTYYWVDEKTGEHFKVTYIADENGFRPSGAHLPVA